MQLDSDQTAKPDSVLWLRAFMRLPIIIDEAHKVLDLDEKILAGIMKAQRAWCTLFSVPCWTPPEISTVRQDDIVLFLGFNDSERNIFFSVQVKRYRDGTLPLPGPEVLLLFSSFYLLPPMFRKHLRFSM